MRKWLLGILLLIVLVFGGGLIIGQITKNNTSQNAQLVDLFNPLVREETVYVQTTSNYKSKYKDSTTGDMDYVYRTTSYNQNGNSRLLEFTSFGKRLRPNKYLKIITKGQNVRSWQQIDIKDIPTAALSKLRSGY